MDREYVDIVTGEFLSSIEVANIVLIYLLNVSSWLGVEG